MKNKIDVSIIIVNYKVENEVLECIGSIYNSKPKSSFEIIIVDNDEKKIIGNKLKKNFPKVKYIESKVNVGYGAGNNIGSEFATGEYLLILNPDTLFLNNVIDSLVSFAEKNNKVGVVAPLLIDKNNIPYELQGTKELTPKRAIFSLSFINKIFPKNKISTDYWNKGWDKTKVKEVDVVPGTAFLMSKTLFERVGGFDAKFFLFFEEFDLCNKIRKLKYKNYIVTDAKLFHKWGSSTNQNKNTNKYFKKSRFYYFKKNYGLFRSVAVEIFLRINTEAILLTVIIIFAIFLRTYRLSSILPFIGDVGWFFMSAKEMVVNGVIPLVGITSSHTWLHQGAFWTYMLAPLLFVSRFNPFFAAYAISLLDVITLVIIYLFARKIFNIKIALIGAIFYASSPLVISQIQVPYHTSVIPFFAVIFLICVFKWVKGKIYYFPLVMMMLAVLYNFEIATFSMAISVLALILFGFVRREKWAKGILNVKIILLSVVAVFIPMIPMLLYDLNHGFPQTVKVVVWMGYRVAVLFGYPELHANAPAENWQTFSWFLNNIMQRFYFVWNHDIALILFLLVTGLAIYKLILSKFKNTSLLILLVFFIIPLLSYIAAKTNSAAYVLMFFPQATILLGYFFGSFRKKLMPISIAAVLLIIIFNSYWVMTVNYFGLQNLKEDIILVKEIIDDVNGRPFNLIGLGGLSQYDSSIDTYKYLAWWLGNEPSKKPQKLKYYLRSSGYEVIFQKRL